MYAFQGKSFMDKNELGNAIGCFNYSIQILTEQPGRKYDISAPGFPHAASGSIAARTPSIRSMKKLIESQRDASKRDNDFIYFQDVPSGETLPDIPAAVFVLKKTDFDPYGIAGRDIHIFIHDPPKKGFFSSIMSSVRGGKESDTSKESQSSPQPETRPRSDSEVARDLQRRIDAGESL